jgi:glycosyltransferase involved in cell wall biosynthesis
VLNNAITLLFYSFVASSLFFGLLNLIRSNIYDVRQSKLRRERAKHPFSRNLRRRPLASVLIYACNNAENISICLTALAANSYKKLEIVVVDNASADASAKLVREFIKKHPKMNIRLVAKKKAAPRRDAIAQAARYAKGDLIAIVDANCDVHKQAIRNCVLHMLHTSQQVVLLNTKADHDYTLMGLADNLKSILASRAKKAGSLITPGLDTHNYAAVYTSQALQIALASARGLDNINCLRRLGLTIGYESLATATIHGAKSTFDLPGTASGYKILRILHGARNLLAALEPFLVAFMVYVAVRFNNPGYIVLAWVSFTSLLALAIWSDETQDLLSKLRLTLLSVVAYSLYLIRQLLGYSRWLAQPAHR